jgi:hypothetical protein
VRCASWDIKSSNIGSKIVLSENAFYDKGMDDTILTVNLAGCQDPIISFFLFFQLIPISFFLKKTSYFSSKPVCIQKKLNPIKKLQ